MPEKVQCNDVFKKRGEIVSRAIAGDTILVPIRGKLADMQVIYSLGPVAALLWEQIDGRNTNEILLAKVLENFEVGQEEAQQDILEFTEELLKAGLIEVAN
ncbi:MAG: PqqD family protein [Thermodesulfovibrionales bacterium]